MPDSSSQTPQDMRNEKDTIEKYRRKERVRSDNIVQFSYTHCMVHAIESSDSSTLWKYE